MIYVIVRKRENDPDPVAEVRSDQKPIMWNPEDDFLAYDEMIERGSEKLFQILYREQDEADKLARSLRFELLVASRRLLSELRDNYVSRSRTPKQHGSELKERAREGQLGRV